MKLSELYWHRITPLHLILWPLSILYGCFLTLKKLSYWLDIFPSVKLPVPVIILDSISVDDGGKTPLIIWLVDHLIKQGFHPGIITRGNSDNPGSPVIVNSSSDPTIVGAKTLFLSQRCEDACQVWVGNDRVATAQALLHAHPLCDILICNDGMHDYRLNRDIEIITVDFSEQSIGNGLVLPAGPLRIHPRSLKAIDFIVTNGRNSHQLDTRQWLKTYPMKLINEIAYNVLKSDIRTLISEFKNSRLHIVTDENNAMKMFDLIQTMKLDAELHTFSNNHRYIAIDLHFSDTDIILMPEENALQCQQFAPHTLWAVPNVIWLEDALPSALLKKLKNENKN